MSINLTRDRSDGRIKSNNRNIVLRGGHYWIFKDDDMPGRCLVKPGEPLPFRVKYNNPAPPAVADYKPPCQKESFPVEELMWAPGGDMLLEHMVGLFNCNFLRFWLTGGTVVSGTGAEPKPLDLTPFVRVKIGGKWKFQVFNAVINNVWNEEYFRKLSSFAEKAENAGVVLQISLFNYFDLVPDSTDGDFRTWSRSPYNPAMSDLPAQYPNWAKNHLVNPANPSDGNSRQVFFLAPTNKLRDVQQAIVKKVVQTLSARTNIIYEVMNEPRGNNGTPQDALRRGAEFSSKVIEWILSAAGTTRRPLISVNASHRNPNTGVYDVDFWRNTPSIPNYDKLDAISYHGLSGYEQETQVYCDGRAPIGVPAVDPGAIQARYERHFPLHSSKSLIYCTDAARTGLHKYPGTNGVEQESQVRDGQIFTNYPNDDKTDTVKNQRRKSDLQNWAYWCFKHAVPNAGKVHFQNHSMNQISYRRIRDAYIQAGGTPATLTANEPVEAAAA